jgi:two-component system, cell cycle sensor histidine kinase and response regulator CckA
MADPGPGDPSWTPSWELRAVLDAITDHVWIATPTADRVLYSNRAYEEIFGEPVEELLSDATSFLPMVAEEDRSVVRHWTGSEPRDAVLHVQRRDGIRRVVRARNFPVRDEGGDITLVAGISEDVTAEHQLREELNDTTERLTSIIESTSDAIVALDRQWRYTFVNGNAGELFGRSPSSLVGRHIWTEYPDGFDQPFARAYERVMATGVPESIEEHYAPWQRWFENRIYPTGEGIVIFFHEITEQKELAAAQREQLRMLDLANVVVFSFDDSRIRYWNAGAERLYGYAPDQALGQRISDLLRTEYPVPVEEIRAQLVREGTWTGSLKHRTRDGREITVASHLVLHQDQEHGEPVVVEANNDISGLVEAQRESAQLRSELNRSERLDALGQLAGGVAHDFNNLLSVILNDLAFALDRLPATSAAASDVTNARRAAERAAALTRQLLVFAQRDTSDPSDVDLDHVVAELTPILERTAGDHIDVHGDPSRFEQVLFNLVVNARDAMPYGGTLTIATTASHTGDHLTLSVTDTGTGMTDDVRRRAFEPFYTTKPKGQGTGLGLSTVFGVAAQCGGSAVIDSAPGQGTTVTVQFPTAAPVARSQPSDDMIGSRVLIIEDDHDLRRSTRQILEAAGHHVTAVVDSNQAGRILTDDPVPDIVVTDLMLPGPPILEILTDVREKHPNLPVIAITGFPPPRRDLLPPPFTLIPKPFTREQLTGTITQMLAG